MSSALSFSYRASSAIRSLRPALRCRMQQKPIRQMARRSTTPTVARMAIFLVLDSLSNFCWVVRAGPSASFLAMTEVPLEGYEVSVRALE